MSQGEHCKAFLASIGSLNKTCSFLDQKQVIKLQGLNKEFYEKTMPRVMTKVVQPSINLVLEKNRNEVCIGLFKRDTRDLTLRRLFKIGSGEGEIPEATLGFKEIYFQYVHMEDLRNIYCWPMENEAILKVGHRLSFNGDKLLTSTPLPPLADMTMRPTIVGWSQKGAKHIMMLGGQEKRWSQTYNIREDKWYSAPKLPSGHNITTNIAVNYKDLAIFTFIIDAQLTIKSAAMDLKNIQLKEQSEGPDHPGTMNWALEFKSDVHKIDRLHLKCAVVTPKGEIAVVARGKPETCVQQISGLVLFFRPVIAENGQHTVEFIRHVRHFPQLFPRQLDFLHSLGEELIFVQDTPDDSPFECYSVKMDKMRSCGKHQAHVRGIFNQ